MSVIRSLDLELPESKYSAKGRNLYVKTKKSSLVFPQRITTSSEYRSKSSIPTEIPLLDTLASPSSKLTRTELQQLFTSNKMASSIFMRYMKSVELMTHSKLVLPVLLFTNTSKEILQNISTDKYEILLEMWIRFQIEMSADVFTLLSFYNESQKKINMEKMKDLISSDIEVAPNIDMSMEHSSFSKFLKEIFVLAENDEIHMINLIYSDFSKYPLNHTLIHKNRDKNIIFSLVDSKIRENHTDASLVNYSLNTYADIVGSYVYHKGGGSSPSPPKLSNIRVLNRNKLSLDAIPSYLSEYGKANIIDDIGSSDYFFSDALENYKEAKNNPKKYSMMKQISKIQQFNATQKELTIEREYIEKSEIDDYIKEKEALKNLLQKTFPKFKLDGYI